MNQDVFVVVHWFLVEKQYPKCLLELFQSRLLQSRLLQDFPLYRLDSVNRLSLCMINPEEEAFRILGNTLRKREEDQPLDLVPDLVPDLVNEIPKM
jgi:hypothetical protein